MSQERTNALDQWLAEMYPEEHSFKPRKGLMKRYANNNTGMVKNELRVTKERVLEAAGKCSTAAAALRTLFPEAFEEEAFKFSDIYSKHTLDASAGGKPLCIGFSLAPDGLSGRCLLVDPHFEMKQQEHNGRTVLTFHPKK